MPQRVWITVLACLCLVPDTARPVGPPPRQSLSLEDQLKIVKELCGNCKLAGRGKDRHVVELVIKSGVTKRKLALLAALDRLERLHILDPLSDPLSEAEIDEVIRVRSLRSLELDYCKFPEEACRKIATMPRLEKLVLSGDLGPRGAVYLGLLRNLRCLKYHDLDDDGFLALSRCPNLESLQIAQGDLTVVGAQAFASMKRLKHLDLGNTKLKPNAQTHLRHLTGLRWLDVSRVKLTDAGFETITRLPLLERLHFVVDINGPSAAALANVSRMKKLEYVVGSNGDSFLKAVSKCPNVEWIYAVEDREVTDAGIAYLAQSPKLRELDLEGTSITDACIPTLIQMKTLRRITPGLSLSQKGIERLKRARPDLSFEQSPVLFPVSPRP